MNDFGFDLTFSYEHLKPALTVSLLSVWVLVGIFHYLNLYTKRAYFTAWTAAWLFYALFLTLQVAFYRGHNLELISMCKQWAVVTSATFFLWGSFKFLKLQTSQRLLGLILGFLLVWSYFVSFHFNDEIWATAPAFGLMGAASLITAWAFLHFRRRRSFVGAGLLAFGFALWGIYLASYPFLQLSPQLVSMGFFLSAVLQLFIAVSMIVLVLEEVRSTHDQTLTELRTNKSETNLLRSKVISTEELYRKLFDLASEGIVIASASDLRLLELNQTARHLLQLSETEMASACLDTFCHVANNPEKIQPQTPSEWCEFICKEHRLTLIRRDGSSIPVEVSGSPVQFAERPAYQFFFREITERTRLEQQLRQAEKLSALGQMISGVAHELNNPMSVIRGYLELILARHELAPQTRADLEKVATESTRAAKLVANFLTFAHEHPQQRQPVDINELILRVLDLQTYELQISGTQLVLDLEPRLPSTMADQDQLQQVIVNLINNALQAMLESNKPRRLECSSRAIGGLIQIKIQDSGPGIAPEIAPHIFEPFFTTKPVGTGTGLGLSIAHSIMTDHRGKIYYEKSAAGGAAFVIEIPVILDEKAASNVSLPVAGAPAESPLARSANILVLDDEAAIGELLGEMLQFLGHKPTVCTSPMQALEKLDSNNFDLVLSDYRMPKMNGQQFYKAAVLKKPELSRKIVFLTGDVVNDETQAFLRSTGNPHLPKPFQLVNVEKVINDILNATPVLAH